MGVRARCREVEAVEVPPYRGQEAPYSPIQYRGREVPHSPILGAGQEVPYSQHPVVGRLVRLLVELVLSAALEAQPAQEASVAP